jgi:pSer/pThr/pTyr-binding forkhead associated (FHA) protein
MMTTQKDKPESAQEAAKTQLRPAANEWKLKPKDPAQKGQVFAVRGEMLIGREGCDIPLKSEHASRKHAKVTLAGDVLRLEDLGSANGTFVNEEQIKESELKPGDEVRFDTDVFVVDGPKQKAAPKPAADDNKTVLRPALKEKEPKKEAAAKKPAEEKKPKPAEEKKPEPAEEKPAAEKATPPAEEKPEEPQRGAWYERETPHGTRKVDAGDLRDQFAQGATQIVRGVKEVEMPSLIGASGDWTGRVIKLDKETMTVGRSGTDIVLDEPSVSSKHAQIVRDGNRWKVVDLMSANGVYVNGKKTQVSFLGPGDAVRFGRLEMRFVTDTTQVESRAAPSKGDDIIRGSAQSSGKGGAWLYLAIGFIVVVAAGAYFLLAG